MSKRLYYGDPVNRAYPLNHGLVSEWAVVPWYASGPRFIDIGGAPAARNHGTLTGSPTWAGALGRPGGYGSLSFVGAVSVSVPNATSLNPAFPTVAAWVRPGISSSYALNKNYDGGSVPYSLAPGGTAFLGFSFYDGTWRTTGITTDLDGDGKWHHVAGSFDGSTLRYYVDGKPDASLSYSRPSGVPTTNTQPLYLGAYINDSGYFSGNADDWMLYDHVLSDSEIFALYDQTRCGNPERWNWVSDRSYFFGPPSSSIVPQQYYPRLLGGIGGPF